jgi:hypothetical protein
MTEAALSLLDAARAYRQRGWMPVPIPAGQKGPRLRGWQKLRLADDDLPHHFNCAGNIGLLLGEPSGWLIDVDLDCPEARELAAEHLPPTPAVTGRPSAPSSHWWYIADGAMSVRHRDPANRSVIVEIRSTGQQTLVGPSTHPSGDIYDFLAEEPARVEAETLAAGVAALAGAVVGRRHGDLAAVGPRGPTPGPPAATGGDPLVRRAAAYLDAMPPAIAGQGGHNATYAAATAMVHGFGLPPQDALALLMERYNPRCHPPWTEKELRHKVGDAASKSHERPFGWLRDTGDVDPDIDLSSIVGRARCERNHHAGAEAPHDPGALPVEALRVPGFVGEVMDHCLATAPYPNPTMAFCGALALQAFLAGRKVRDPADNRTNLYLLGLAHSSSGKDWPRKLNARVLHAVGLANRLADQIASGEGIQDALFVTPSLLVQTDEIDALLQSMKHAREARFESIMATLLTIYSSSNSVFPMRRTARNPEPGVIDQPSLVLLGTAIPNHYYAALSERMLTNGLFARMLVLESGPRGAGQEPVVGDLPQRIVETASWWADLRPGAGDLAESHPQPRVVPQTEEAQRLLVDLRVRAEEAYAEAEWRSDAVATTVWGRVSENARKLALVYAISENHREPEIGADAVRWASRLVVHQVERMLFMAAGHAAEGDFDAMALRAIRKLREAPGRALPHSTLLKRMKIDAKTFRELIETLIQTGDVLAESVATAGRSGLVYRYVGDQQGE